MSNNKTGKGNQTGAKGKFRLGVSGKMLLGVTVPIIAILIILAIVIIVEVVNVFSDLKKTDITNQMESVSVQVPEYFETFFVSEQYIMDRASIQEIFAEMEQSPADYRFEESELFDEVMRDLQYAHEVCGSAAQSVWIAGLKNNELVQSDGYISDSSYVVKQRAWYQSVLAKPGEGVLSAVYEDASTGKLVVTIVTPYKNAAGEMIAFVGIDLSMDELESYFGSLSIGDSGYVTVYDSADNIVYHPDTSLIMTNMSQIAYSDNMKAALESQKSSEIMNYQRGSSDFYGGTFYIDEYAWSVLACMPTDEYMRETTMVVWTLIIGFLSCIVVSALICLFRTRSIIKPLHSLGAVAQEFAKGQLHSKVSRSADDEIGDLEEVFAEMQTSLQEIIYDVDHVLKAISSKNLTVDTSAEYHGDFRQIEQSLQGITESMNQLISNIDMTAGEVDAGAEQVSSGAQALAQGATEQSSSVEELAGTINEALQKTQQMSESAQQASTKADNVGEVVQESNGKMSQMMHAMERINQEANKINNIIKTIEDIAFQTNILALNAAVEAARAGDAGKGFAVVADEVRSLAGKSAEASQSTATLISNALSAVKEGMVLAEDTTASLASAASNVVNVVEDIGSVSAELAEHADAMQQLTIAIDQISSVVQTNAATAEESAAVSEEMSAQATSLKHMMSEFKLKDQARF